MKGTRTGSSRELDGDRFAEVVLEFWRTILGAWMSNIAWKQFSGSRKVQRIQFVSRERKKKSVEACATRYQPGKMVPINTTIGGISSIATRRCCPWNIN